MLFASEFTWLLKKMTDPRDSHIAYLLWKLKLLELTELLVHQPSMVKAVLGPWSRDSTLQINTEHRQVELQEQASRTKCFVEK